MFRRPLIALALSFVIAAGAGCGEQIDLAKSLKVTDILSGYYDDGIKGGVNHLVPSISFRLQNTGTGSINEVQLLVSFWKDGDDGEWDSSDVVGIGRESVAPGASSDPILVRGRVGYNLEGMRADLFVHSKDRDTTAKMFAKRGGRITAIGEFKLDQRIIPHLGAPGPQ